jgi:hypothetical protein
MSILMKAARLAAAAKVGPGLIHGPEKRNFKMTILLPNRQENGTSDESVALFSGFSNSVEQANSIPRRIESERILDVVNRER